MTLDANEFAALLDGSLAPDARARVLAQIEASPELREIFAEAIVAQRMLEDEAPKALPIDRSSTARALALTPSHRRWKIAPLAAAALLVVTTGLFFWNRNDIDADLVPASGMIALLTPSAVGVTAPMSALGIVRGTATGVSSEQARAIRLGAELTRAQLQLASGDSLFGATLEASARSLDEIPAGSAAGSTLRKIARRQIDAGTAAALARATAVAERFVDRDAMRAGAWLMALRAAALRQDAAFVRAPSTDAAFRVLRALAANLSGGSRTDADAAINALASEIDRSTTNWIALNERAAALLRTVAK